MGHRLVLVLTRVRRPESAAAAMVAAALPAQQLLLEAARVRPAVPHRRRHREVARSSAARTCRAGRGGADRAVRGVRGLVPIRRADRADLVVPTAGARTLAALSDAALPHLRQCRFLVVGT